MLSSLTPKTASARDLFESFGDLSGYRDGLVRGNRPSLQPLRKILSLHQLHGQEMDVRCIVDPRALESVQMRDVRVIEGREHSRLPLEAGEPFGVLRESSGQDLDRDIAPELGVLRAIDLAHATRADGGGDLEGAKADAGRQSHGVAQSSGCPGGP